MREIFGNIAPDLIEKGGVRVLLADGTNSAIRHELPKTADVATVEDKGWASKKWPDFLKLAAKNFDVLICTNQSAPSEKQTARHNLAVIVMEPDTRSLEDLGKLIPRVNELIRTAKPRCIYRVFEAHRAKPEAKP